MFDPSPDDDGLVETINITPLVDVVLVLLVTFMVVSPALTIAGLDLSLPEASSANQPPAPPLIITLSPAQPPAILDTAPNATEADFLASLRAHTAQAPPTQIMIAADGDTPHAEVVRTLDLLMREGHRQIVFGVEGLDLPPPTPTRGD